MKSGTKKKNFSDKLQLPETKRTENTFPARKLFFEILFRKLGFREISPEKSFLSGKLTTFQLENYFPSVRFGKKQFFRTS